MVLGGLKTALSAFTNHHSMWMAQINSHQKIFAFNKL
jgi:hypothetical protein